jgi:hypothetical protein
VQNIGAAGRRFVHEATLGAFGGNVRRRQLVRLRGNGDGFCFVKPDRNERSKNCSLVKGRCIAGQASFLVTARADWMPHSGSR